MGDFFVAPGGATERAMIGAGIILVTGELADLTKRGEVKVIAVAVEAIFGEILVVFNAVFGAEPLGLVPGLGFNLDKLNIRIVICLAQEIVAEFVEQQELSFVGFIFAV